MLNAAQTPAKPLIVPYAAQLAAARAWMEAQRVHQLGTEHLEKRK